MAQPARKYWFDAANSGDLERLLALVTAAELDNAGQPWLEVKDATGCVFGGCRVDDVLLIRFVGWTLLHRSANHGRLNVVQFLLDR
jgi:hypothetical protein